jgi:hypothetical protein
VVSKLLFFKTMSTVVRGRRPDDLAAWLGTELEHFGDVSAWLQLEFERLGEEQGTLPRQTKAELKGRLATAMKGPLAELNKLTPAERLVMDPQYSAPAPLEVRDRHVSEDVTRETHVITEQEMYERELTKRDAVIFKLQSTVDELMKDLRSVRDSAERTQRSLEDEIRELRARRESQLGPDLQSPLLLRSLPSIHMSPSSNPSPYSRSIRTASIQSRASEAH